MGRKASIKRKTKETDILIELELGSVRESEINSGVPFFDHMLSSMARHGRFYLKLKCKGDYEIDDHHSVEDVGITLGQAFKEALGDRAGTVRFSDATVPMDDALSLVAIDLSGRPFFQYNGRELKGYVGKYNEELTMEFLRSFATHAGINLHVNLYYGDNGHHVHESIFKALAVSLYRAATIDISLKGEIPSTKGTIS